MTTPDVWIRYDILSREQVVCDKPLLAVDLQMRLNIVRPDVKVLPKKFLFYYFGSDGLLFFFG